MRITPILLLLSACATEADLGESSQDLTSYQSDLSHNRRREIGRWGGCTATLIGSQWALSSASCWRNIDGRNAAGVPSNFDSFSTTDDNTNPLETVAVDRSFAFTQIAGQIGQNDLMLLHLAHAPTTATPTSIQPSPPTFGTPAVQWGIGCTGADGSGFGTLRHFSTTVGAATPIACSGDQGGPKTVGAYPGFLVYQVQSNAQNSYADPVFWKPTVDAIMSEWNLNAARDIYLTGWCTGTNDHRFDVDANADGQPDAVCWNSATGNESFAMGHNRLVVPTGSIGNVGCVGPNQELLTGDFDADGRTDLLCHTKNTGANKIDWGRNSYAGFEFNEPVTGWCSHSTGQLHVGDFNGDGASDLMCHDTVTGHTWVDINPAGTGNFDGVSELDLNTTFCSHAGAKLLIGDVDGNGMSDLICHTPSTGQIHIDRTYSSDKFGGVDFTLDAGTPFCTNGRVEVGDYDGDRRADLKCVTPTGTWPSLYASTTGTFSAANEFGYGGEVAPRTISVKNGWSYER